MVSELLTIGPLASSSVNHVSRTETMDSFTRVPVTMAAIAAMTAFLSGCIAVDAASTAVDAGTSVVTTTADVVTSPFDSSDSDKAKK